MIKLISHECVVDDHVLIFPYSLQQADCSVSSYWNQLSTLHLHQTEDDQDGYRILTEEALGIILDKYDVWLVFSETWSKLPTRLRSYVTLLKAEKKTLGPENVVEKEVAFPDGRTVRSAAVRVTRKNLKKVTDRMLLGYFYIGVVNAPRSGMLTEEVVQQLILLGNYDKEHLDPNVPRLAHHLLPEEDVAAVIRLFASQDYEYLSFYLKPEHLPALEEMLRNHFRRQLVAPV